MERKKAETGTLRVIKLWTGAIFAAFLAAAAIYVALLQTEKSVLAEYEKGKVCFAIKKIPRGQMITEANANEFIVVQEMDVKLIPETAVLEIDAMNQLVAEGDIDQGAMLTESMFREIDEITADMKEPVIAGFCAEDLSQLAGGVLRAGDRIHVYASRENGETFLIWENVYVQQVFDLSGKIIENSDQEAAAQRINVFLDKENVEAFYKHLSQGTLKVVKAWN